MKEIDLGHIEWGRRESQNLWPKMRRRSAPRVNLVTARIICLSLPKSYAWIKFIKTKSLHENCHTTL